MFLCTFSLGYRHNNMLNNYLSVILFLSYSAMKADRKRLKMEKAELVNQMQQLYATLESREEQLRDFIRNYEQHRKVTHTHSLT